MPQYNLAASNNMSSATLVVNAGDPETLILNHSTKNTVYIGPTSAVGTGNLLDATPLDPYASIVVNGTVDVFAVAENQSLPATVYTFQNAVTWSPRAIQPNIIDPGSPYTVPNGITNFTLTVPATAQGVMLGFADPLISVGVFGIESGIIYADFDPSTLENGQPTWWIPVLSDADSTIRVELNNTGALQEMQVVWIMTQFASASVPDGQPTSVVITGITGIPPGEAIPVTNEGSTSLNVDVTNTASVAISDVAAQQLAANQVPVAFDITLASLATSSAILAASAGTRYYIHSFRVEPEDNSSTTYCQLQDTTGAALANIFNVEFAAGTTYGPVIGPNPFNGAPLATGVGVQLKNMGTATQRFIGYITYAE
jgi:hypothetical protein